MATNSKIWFGGRLLPCTVERFPAIKKAQRKFRQYNVPGRNGDVFFQDDAFENVVASYDVYATDEYFGAVEAWKNLAAVLYQKGYQKLRDTYDPDHFRKAVFNGPIDVENSWNTHGRATIEFNCRPERYLMDGNVPVSYSSEALGFGIWNMSDLSDHLRGLFSGTNSNYVYSVPIEGGDHTIIFMNMLNDGVQHTVAYIAPGTESSAGGSASQRGYGTRFQKTGVTARDMLVPASYFNGLPIISIDGSIVGGPASLVNDYMPSYPDIVLHAVTSHNSEVIAAMVNGSGIYISEYLADYPYYFIDTENFSASMSETLNGSRILANNVRIDPGLKLANGENLIYTSAYYEMTLTPNWWEL